MEKNKMIKPEFKGEIKAEIKGIGQIEDNIKEVQNFAIELASYYENVIFTEDSLKDAKNEKADVNKFKKKVSDFRKEITNKWNEPLQKFVETAKTTETMLTDTYNLIDNQVKAYEEKTKEEIKELCIFFFDEYAVSKGVEFLKFEQMNMNITLGLATDKGQLTKKAKEEIALFIDKVVDDINLINTQEYIDEMMIEYKKDLNVSRAITDVKERHIELEKAKEEKESKKEQELTNEVMLEKIENLTVPKVEEKEQILEITFKVRGTKEKLREVKQFLENGGYDYE